MEIVKLADDLFEAQGMYDDRFIVCTGETPAHASTNWLNTATGGMHQEVAVWIT